MATLASTIKLNDKMSAVLQKINNIMGTTTKTMNQVNSAAENMESEMNKTANAGKSMTSTVDRGSDSLQKMAGKVETLIATYVSLQGVIKLAQEAMDLFNASNDQLKAETQLATVMKNMGNTVDDYNEVIEKASSIQSEGMFGDEAMIAGAGELATYMSDVDALTTMMDTLTDYAAGMSGGAEVGMSEMVEYAEGLGKAMDGTYTNLTKKGFVLSDAQKAIIDGTATEAQMVSVLGDEWNSMSDDMQQATVISQVIEESWGGLYDTMSNTPSGALASIKNTFSDMKEELGAGITPALMNLFSIIQSKVIPFLEAHLGQISNFLSGLIDTVSGAVEWAVNFASAIADNWGVISPIIEGIAVAMGVFTVATKAQQIATALLSAEMWACPFTWIVAAISAVIGIITLVVKAINNATGSTTSALGVIVGIVSWAGSLIWNIVKGVVNAVLGVVGTFIAYIQNSLGAVANFVGNIFNDPLAAVAHLFATMATNVLNVLASLAKVIDTIFGSNLAGSVNGWIDNLNSWADSVGNGSYNSYYDTNNKATDYQIADHTDMTDAYSAGYNAGASFGSGTAYDASQYTTDPSSILSGSSSASETASDVSDIADSTSDIADSTSGVSEDLKWIREIAEQEHIDKYTTAEITVNFTSNANVNSTTDADLVFGEFSSLLAQTVSTAKAGA